MLIIALVLALVAAASVALLNEAGRVMLPGVDREAPVAEPVQAPSSAA